MNDMDTAESASPARRPAGVWILSTLNLVISGVFPILTAFAFFFAGNGAASWLDAIVALLQAALGGAIIWTTIGAWQGRDRFRRALLKWLVAFHMLQIASNLTILAIGGVPSQSVSRFAGAIVRSAFWMGINLWYFLRHQTREWYEEVEALRT